MTNKEIIESLPQYRCHKIVRAARIMKVQLSIMGDAMLTAQGIPEQFFVDVDFVKRNHPESNPGAWFVLYDDGYQSLSPHEAFVNGYTRLDVDPSEGYYRVLESGFPAKWHVTSGDGGSGRCVVATFQKETQADAYAAWQNAGGSKKPAEPERVEIGDVERLMNYFRDKFTATAHESGKLLIVAAAACALAKRLGVNAPKKELDDLKAAIKALTE